MSDNGLLDVLIGGEGICGKIHLSSSAHKHRVFDVKDVKVTMQYVFSSHLWKLALIAFSQPSQGDSA